MSAKRNKKGASPTLWHIIVLAIFALIFAIVGLMLVGNVRDKIIFVIDFIKNRFL